LTFPQSYGDSANPNPTTTEVIHGTKTGNKIPRGQEIPHHKEAFETRRRGVADEKPNGARSEVDDTTHNSQASGSGAREEADDPALAEDTDSPRRLGKETSQSNSAGDGVHQPEHAYLAVRQGSVRLSADKVSAGRLHTSSPPAVLRLPAGG
jgi:hypothetical protein